MDRTTPALIYYTIHIDGLLDARWADWFDGMLLTHSADGTTTLCGPITDQAALYGLIARARDLGLTLLALERVDGCAAC